MEKRQKITRVGTYRKDKCFRHHFDEQCGFLCLDSKEKLRTPEPDELLEVIIF